MWILFATFYGVFSGFYAVYKKKAVEKSSTLFVLALSSSIGFLLVSWCAGEAFSIGSIDVLFILLKSVVVSLAWITGLIAFKYYYISSLQPISSIRVILSFVASILIFNESVYWWKLIGVAIIFVTLVFLNLYDKKSYIAQGVNSNLKKRYISAYLKGETRYSCYNLKADISKSFNIATKKEHKLNKRVLAIALFIVSCVLHEVSGIMDKLILNNVETNQMQFWFMLFVSIILWIYLLGECVVKKKNVIKKSDWKNIFIYILPFFLIVGDRFLFTALRQPDVVVSGVSMLKQLATVVSVIYGGILFKEPKLKYKIIYLVIILCGIVLVVI